MDAAATAGCTNRLLRSELGGFLGDRWSSEDNEDAV